MSVLCLHWYRHFHIRRLIFCCFVLEIDFAIMIVNINLSCVYWNISNWNFFMPRVCIFYLEVIIDSIYHEYLHNGPINHLSFPFILICFINSHLPIQLYFRKLFLYSINLGRLFHDIQWLHRCRPSQLLLILIRFIFFRIWPSLFCFLLIWLGPLVLNLGCQYHYPRNYYASIRCPHNYLDLWYHKL